jgi:hypothetical protein
MVALFGYAAFYTIAYGTVIWCWCLIGDPIVMALRVLHPGPDLGHRGTAARQCPPSANAGRDA